MVPFPTGSHGNFNQIDADLAECDALEHVLAEYVVAEAARKRTRRTRTRGRVHGHDLVVWAAVLPAVAFGAARRGIVTADTSVSFLAYTRQLDRRQLTCLVRRLFKIGSRQAATLPPAA